MIDKRKTLIIKTLNEYSDILKQILDKKMKWFSNILTLSIGLFGILVSLRDTVNDTIYQKQIFVIIICTLALGILFGVIYLYSEIVILILQAKKKKEYIRKLNDEKEKFYVGYLDAHWIYYFCGYFALLMFFVSLISIVLYSVSQNL